MHYRIKGTYKFQNQLAAVARPIQAPRYRRGKSSAFTAQASGPQLTAKAAIAKQEKATRTVPAVGVFIGFSESMAKWPTKA
jgi:hypothetical protein